MRNPGVSLTSGRILANVTQAYFSIEPYDISHLNW